MFQTKEFLYPIGKVVGTSTWPSWDWENPPTGVFEGGNQGGLKNQL